MRELNVEVRNRRVIGMGGEVGKGLNEKASLLGSNRRLRQQAWLLHHFFGLQTVRASPERV